VACFQRRFPLTTGRSIRFHRGTAGLSLAAKPFLSSGGCGQPEVINPAPPVAELKGDRTTAATESAPKGKMSAATRTRIAAAQRARWAKLRADGASQRTSTLPNPAIQCGVMTQFSICIADVLRRRPEALIPTTAACSMVHVQPAAEPHPFSVALLEGAESTGLERFPNPHGRMMEAAGGCAVASQRAWSLPSYPRNKSPTPGLRI
jgi:hypothetical protein